MGYVCRLCGYTFLAAGVCLLVGEAGPKARADLLIGGIGAQPVPGHGLASCWVGQIHRLQGCGFLVVGVRSLMGRLVLRLDRLPAGGVSAPWDSGDGACPLLVGTWSQVLWLESPESLGFSACALESGFGSWAF